MQLTPAENEALARLARHGALPLGHGSDAVPASTAIRLALAGFAELTLQVGEQVVALTSVGRAFNHRTVR